LSGAYLLIESTEFTRCISSYFGSDEAYARFQAELVESPQKGAVIPGVAPLRKVRWSDVRRSKGKRGGLRVVYIHIADLRVLYLLDVYDKDEADDLSEGEKKSLRTTARQLVAELRDRKERGRL
jgi:hypothetical protein